METSGRSSCTRPAGLCDAAVASSATPIKARALPCARAPESTGLGEVAKLMDGGRESPKGSVWAATTAGSIQPRTASHSAERIRGIGCPSFGNDLVKLPHVPCLIRQEQNRFREVIGNGGDAGFSQHGVRFVQHFAREWVLAFLPLPKDDELHVSLYTMPFGQIDHEVLPCLLDDRSLHQRKVPPQFPTEPLHERLDGREAQVFAVDVLRSENHGGFDIDQA